MMIRFILMLVAILVVLWLSSLGVFRPKVVDFYQNKKTGEYFAVDENGNKEKVDYPSMMTDTSYMGELYTLSITDLAAWDKAVRVCEFETVIIQDDKCIKTVVVGDGVKVISVKEWEARNK
jgi:hypothetical protein